MMIATLENWFSIHTASSADDFWWWMLGGLPLTALIAVAIGVGSRVARHPAFWHTAWLLLCAKLFLPLAWSIPLAGKSPVDVSANEVAQQSRPVSSEIIVSDQRSGVGEFNTELSASKPAEQPDTDSRLPSVFDSAARMTWSWPLLALLLWPIGSAVILIRLLLACRRAHRLIGLSTVPADDLTSQTFQAIAEQLGCHRRAKVVMGKVSLPPMLWTIGGSTLLYLPSALWSELDESQRRLILSHEAIHLRRRDDQVRWFVALSCTVFWWNPLVWIASSELRRLEEEACDATIARRHRADLRIYAGVLLRTIEFLSMDHQREVDSNPDLSPSLLPAVPMAGRANFHHLARRINLLSKPTHLKWRPYHFAIIGLLLVTPIGLRLTPSIAAAPAGQAAGDTATDPATISGTLTDKDGKPIADALVTVAHPQADLRFMHEIGDDVQIKTTRTDDSGRYRLRIDSSKDNSSASIDFAKPGFKRLVGTQMAGGSPNTLELKPGAAVTFDAELEPAWYVAGKVVDESGQPMPGVLVAASYCGKTFCAGVARVRTDDRGRFEVFGYQDMLFAAGLDGRSKRDELFANLQFYKTGYMVGEVEDIDKMDRAKLSEIAVTMKEGMIYAGQLLTPDGDPAAGRLISVMNQQSYQYNAAVTDDQGNFKVVGLTNGAATLTVSDFANSAKLKKELDLEQNLDQQTLSLMSVAARPPRVYEFAGMKLGELTPELKAAYLTSSRINGAILIDPGPNAEAFEIGELKPGDVFFMAGNDRAEDLADFIRTLAREATKPSVPPGAPGNLSAMPLDDGGMAVRVVYTFANERSMGSNTQYMNLTSAQVAELQQLARQLDED